MVFPSVDLGTFAASARVDGASLWVTLSGTAEAATHEGVREAVAAIHSEAARLVVGEVVVDIRELEYMSSPCFKFFVRWLTDLRGATAPAYRVRFVSNPERGWQRRSLRALACLAMDIVTIEA